MKANAFPMRHYEEDPHLACLKQQMDETDRAHPSLDLNGHSSRVSILTTLLAKTMGLCKHQARQMGEAAYYHDVGKLFLAHSPLEKSGPLSAQERSKVEEHSELGADAMKAATGPIANMARDIARWHHERYDGHGYPDRMQGNDIPLAARIVAIADVYDALRSIRPYKPYRSHEEVVHNMMDSARGIVQGFDPLVVEAFQDILSDINGTWNQAMLFRINAMVQARGR